MATQILGDLAPVAAVLAALLVMWLQFAMTSGGESSPRPAAPRQPVRLPGQRRPLDDLLVDAPDVLDHRVGV